jgi:hypothetical protein
MGIAQITSYYALSTLTGQSFVPMASPSTVSGVGGSYVGSSDDGRFSITLPWTFQYYNTSYNQVWMCSNGWASMGADPAGNSFSNTVAFTTTAPNNTLGIWTGDANANFGTTTPNGPGTLQHGADASGNLYVLQWNNTSASSGGLASTTNSINMQIVLWGPGSSNPGRIDYIYGATTGTVSASRGIALEVAPGGIGNFINALNGSTTSTTTAAVWPGNGNGYRFDWTPPCLNTSQTVTFDPCITPGQYTVTVNVTALGSAPSINITSSVDGTLFTGVGLGSYVLGPYAFGTARTFTLVHNGNSICNVNLGTFGAPGALPNDDPWTASAISCGQTISATTVGAATDTYTNCGAGGTSPQTGIWYTVIGDGGFYTATTCNATGFDTRLTVYSGSCSSLSCIGGNDDDNSCAFSTVRSSVNWQTTNGTQYYIFVHGFSGTGAFQLTLNCTAPCTPAVTNDDCTTAQALPINFGATCTSTVSGNTNCATAPITNPNCFSQFATLPDVWYTLSPSSTEDLQLTITYGTATSLGATLYSGSCGTLTELGCLATVTSGSPVTISGLTPGTYYLQILGPQANRGSFTACVTPVVPVCATYAAPANGGTANAAGTTLSWNAASSANGYRLYFGTDGGGVTLPTSIANGLDLGNVLTYATGALSTSTTYYWAIVPYNSIGGPSICTIFSFATNPPACVSAPTSPTDGGVACAGGGTTLSWPVSPGATGYDVVLDGNTVSANQPGTTYNAGVLAAGPHTWSIIPQNGNGPATGCPTWSFSVIAAPAGDTFANAISITGLPYSSSGNNNLEANCYTNANALRGRDKIWSLLTTGCTTSLTIGICGPIGDSFLYLVAADQSTVIASNDDDEPSGCTNGLSSSLTNVAVSPNTLYYIIMDGFGATTDLTDYTLTVSANCFCTSPAAAITGVSENCAAGTFTVGVNVTSTGSTGTANVIYTVNGGSPVTVSNVSAGALTLPTSGSFAQGANVYITISTSDNACSSVVGYATDNCPVDFACEDGPIQVTNYCYGNASTKTWTFTQTTSPLETLTLRFISGCFNAGDNLLVYEFDGGPLVGSIDGTTPLPALLTNTNGPSLYLVVNSDASGSCADGACTQPWNFEVFCTPGCTAPSWNTPSINAACSTIDVSITDLADYNGGTVELITTVLPSGTPVSTSVSTIGTYTVGPFIPGQQVQIQLFSSIDGCNNQTQSLGTITIPAQPPGQVLVATASPSIICPNGTTTLNAVQLAPPPAVPSYVFESFVGSYTPVTGGVLFGTTATDDQYYTNPATPTTSSTTGPGTPIGFSFTFNGTTYDRIGVNANGWVSFGQSTLTPAVNMATTSAYTPLASTAAITPAHLRNRIAAMAADLQAQAGAELRVETIGNAPNRVCVIQWTNYKRFGTAGNGHSLNFQIRLHETSNYVDVVYGPMTWNATSSTAHVGLGGSAAAQYNNRTTTTDWNNTTAGGANTASCTFSTSVTPPTAGRVFRWRAAFVTGLSYSWSPAALVVDANNQTTATQPLSGNTTFTVNSTGGDCPRTAQVTVEIGPALSATINPPVASICGVTPVTLTVVATGVPPFTYAWTDPNNAPVGGPTTTSVSATIGGTWTCVVTDACGSVTATRNVVANPTPVASITPTAPICVGGSVTLTADSDQPGSSFAWTGAAPVGGSTNASVTISGLTVANNGTYSVVATANGCASAPANYNLVVNPNPNIVSVTATPATVCNGGNSQLNALATVTGYTIGSGGSSYINISGTGTAILGVTDDSEHNITFPSFTFNGVAYTSARVGNNGMIALGSSTGEIVFTNAALPTAANTAGNVLLAPWWDDLIPVSGQGNNTIFTQQVGNLFIIQWNNEDHFAAPGAQITFQLQMDLSTGVIYFVYPDVIFSAMGDGFSGGASATVGIQFSASSALQYSFNTQSLVDGQVISFTPNAAAYSWSNGLPSIPNPLATNITPPTTFTVTATNTASGCTSQGTVTVNLNTTDTDGDGVIDCIDSCPTVPGQVGTACTIGLQVGVLDNDCVCQLCTTDLALDFTMDSGSSMNWEIRVDGSNFLIQSGSTILGPTAFTANTCLPNGCYNLRVTDAQGDGITGGGYVLRLASGSGPYTRVVDNRENYAGVTPSQISGPPVTSNAFCIPLGTDRLIYTSCDKMDWRLSCNGEYVVATDNPAVTAQYNVTNSTSGYEMWWYAPNGGYSFRRVQYHSTPNGLAASATRACHFRPNSWTGNALQQDVLYNVKVRSIVAGTPAPWGPACRFMLSEAGAACPRTQLMDLPDSPYLSCGQSRPANSTSSAAFVHARPVRRMNGSCQWVNANRYQFRFRIVGEGINVVKTSATNQYWVNTVGLVCGKTYVVDVRASFDNGATWCAPGGTGITDPAWGVSCNLTTNPCAPAQGGNQNMAAEGAAAGLKMYPNPNRGDQLLLSLDGIEQGVATVSVDIYDAFGKRAIARTLPVSDDGFVNSVLELNGSLAAGLYTVSITAGERQFNERLVIQP